jgi:hypothetical protein
VRTDTVTPKTWRRPNRSAMSVTQLGRVHFWLFTAILGSLLGLFALIFAAHLSTL